MSESRPAGGTATSSEVEAAPDLVAILKRRWLIIALCLLVGVAAAQAFVSVRSTTYEARSTLLLIAAENEVSPSGGRARTVDVDTWATVARSTDLLRQVAEDLDLELSVVQANTSATAAATGDILILASEAPTSGQAVEAASVYSQRFLESRQASINAVSRERRQQLEELEASLLSELDELGQQIELEESGATNNGNLPSLQNEQQVALDRLGSVSVELDQLGVETNTGQVVVQPDTAVGEIGLGTTVILLSGLLAGALIGFVMALLRDRYDDRYRSVNAMGHFGVEEIARVDYSESDEGGGDEAASVQRYSRLLVRLMYSQRQSSDLGRTVLIVSVESDHLPADAGDIVAARLKATSPGVGVSVSVMSHNPAKAARGGRRQAASQLLTNIGKAQNSSDLVLVPRPALDGTPASIGIAATADVTLLLVTHDTRTSAIERVVQDLENVGASEIKIAVVETGRRFSGSSSKRRRSHASAAEESTLEWPSPSRDDEAANH